VLKINGIRPAGGLVALGLLTLGTARADEFTVGRSGADIALAQYGLTGSGVGVAVIDSGVTTNRPDLLSTDLFNPTRVKAAVNFASSSKNAFDECGHGTHVAGIIAGNGADSYGFQYFRTFYGIARKANVISIKVLDKNGQGNVSEVIAGIQWVIINKSKYNIRVINLSVGHPAGESYKTDPLCLAVEAAWKAGIVVVCAAGNDGRASSLNNQNTNEGWGSAYGSINSPGNDPYVITVGAMKNFDGVRAHDRIATYSSRGPSRLDFILKPDLVAPGNQVISVNTPKSTLSDTYGKTNAVPNSSYDAFPIYNSWNYFRLSGTSMAAPVVSGAAALLLQKDPSLSPDSIKARLMLSADKWGDPSGVGDPCTYGAGYLNIPGALTNTAVATSPALSPQLYRDASGNVCIDTKNLLGGTQVIWGVNGISNLQVLWGTQVIWGSQTISGSQIIWGSAVWEDQVIWGTSGNKVDLTSTTLNGEN
jgi:serine protease AprX